MPSEVAAAVREITIFPAKVKRRNILVRPRIDFPFLSSSISLSLSLRLSLFDSSRSLFRFPRPSINSADRQRSFPDGSYEKVATVRLYRLKEGG